MTVAVRRNRRPAAASQSAGRRALTRATTRVTRRDFSDMHRFPDARLFEMAFDLESRATAATVVVGERREDTFDLVRRECRIEGDFQVWRHAGFVGVFFRSAGS